jgi:hypothetical protein
LTTSTIAADASATWAVGDYRLVTTDPLPKVLGCTWLWFNTFRIDLDLPDADPGGTTVGMSVSLFQGDVSSSGAAGVLTTHGTGTTSVVVTGTRPKPSGEDVSVYRSDRLAPAPGSTCEVDLAAAAGYKTPNAVTSAKLQYDTQPPASDGTAFGDLIASARASESPQFLLADLLYQLPAPPFDRVYLAADLPLDYLTVSHRGSCVTVDSGYRIGNAQAPAVTVHQARGCAPIGPPPAGITVTDPNWSITVSTAEGVTASDAQKVADHVQRIDIPGTASATGPAAPTADEWFAGYYTAHPEIRELVRFPWHDSVVAVVHRDGTPASAAYEEPVTFGASANLGSAAIGCVAYTIGIAGNGYAWFVATQPGIHIDVKIGGIHHAVNLVTTPIGPEVGFMELNGVAVQPTDVTVTDTAGNLVPCKQ